MTKSSIQLVCFDLGGVIVRVADGWADAAKCAGVTAYDLLTGDGEIDLAGLAHAWDTGGMSAEQFSCAVSRKLSRYTPDQILAVINAWLGDPYPQVERLIADLHERGVSTACLSNTNDRHWLTMHENNRFRIVPMIQHRFASFLLGFRKPDARMYEHVEQAMGLQPNQIVFFDDRADNIAAAQQRGWSAVRITPDQSPADQMRRTLTELNMLN